MNIKETTPQTQEIETEPKRYIYKGINIRAFEHYFKNGGIAPIDPKVGWLTDSPERAHEMAWAQIFIHRSPAYCLIVADYNFLFEHSLGIDQSYGTPYGHNADFRGQATISWHDIRTVITTEEGELAIAAVAKETDFPRWEDLQRKIVQIPNPIYDPKPTFIDEILQLNRRRLI